MSTYSYDRTASSGYTKVVNTSVEALKAMNALPKKPDIRWEVLMEPGLLQALGIKGRTSSGEEIHVGGYIFRSSGVSSTKDSEGVDRPYLRLQFVGWEE